MGVTTEMYTKLFNELTDIMNERENIKERIKNIQLETEEIYINRID
ncbi:MAG: CooT family nickel-binding protein [Clostridia bacterium]|nr:CooT family nickel-binding protein [Clostridia bacterium]